MTQQTSYSVAVAAVDDSHANWLARAQRMMTLGKSREWKNPVLATVFIVYLNRGLVQTHQSNRLTCHQRVQRR